MIRRVKGGWKVKSHTKGFLSKKPKSKKEAFKQLYAIQMNKYRKGKITKVEFRQSMKNALKRD